MKKIFVLHRSPSISMLYPFYHIISGNNYHRAIITPPRGSVSISDILSLVLICPKNRKGRGSFRFLILMTIMILAITLFTYVVRIPVDRKLSGMHQKNTNASCSDDSYDSYDMELGSSGTDWDASFCSFSYIIRIGDRKNPRYLRSS